MLCLLTGAAIILYLYLGVGNIVSGAISSPANLYNIGFGIGVLLLPLIIGILGWFLVGVCLFLFAFPRILIETQGRRIKH